MMNMDNSPTEKTNEEGEKSTAAAQSTGSLAGTGKVSSPASRKEQNEWNKMFDRLAAFKKKNGHVNVDKTDLELAVWVAKQRELNKARATGKGGSRQLLTDEQKEKLTNIGLEWQPKNPRHLQWETRFGQLQAFKQKYGHVQVPIGWSENPQLANWVSKQRQEYKNLIRGRTTRLDDNRINSLNEIGFAWQLQRGGRRRQLKARSSSKKEPATAAGEDGGDCSSSHSGNGSNHSQDNEEDDDGPCILPGEVLIGQGAKTAAAARAVKNSANKATNKSKKQDPAGAVAGNFPGATSGQDPPARHGMLSSPFQQQQQQLQLMQNMQSSLLTSSQFGLPISGLSGAFGAGANAPSTNRDFLEFVFARNALLNKIHRQQQQQQQQQMTPSSMSRRGLTGLHPSFPFPQVQQQAGGPLSHDQLMAVAHAQIQAQARVQALAREPGTAAACRGNNSLLAQAMTSTVAGAACNSLWPNSGGLASTIGMNTNMPGAGGASDGNAVSGPTVAATGAARYPEESKHHGNGQVQTQQQTSASLNFLELLQQQARKDNSGGGGGPSGSSRGK